MIDELDRSDEEFESFLLEILSEWQITIPEIGTIKASEPPYVILTSNRTRELSDAVRRRCFYLWLDYPEFEKELAIVRAKIPGIDERLGQQICLFMEMIREEKLKRCPVWRKLWIGPMLWQSASGSPGPGNDRGDPGDRLQGQRRC